MTDANSLRELATNALTGHWPKHLGVNTDAERIEWLARQLEAAADNVGDVDDLEEKLDAAEEKSSALQDEVDELRDELKKKE